MNEINDGGRAFPQYDSDMYGQKSVTGGMTLCDYFAAKAMQGLISGAADREMSALSVANACYAMADALLFVREAK